MNEWMNEWEEKENKYGCLEREIMRKVNNNGEEKG